MPQLPASFDPHSTSQAESLVQLMDTYGDAEPDETVELVKDEPKEAEMPHWMP